MLRRTNRFQLLSATALSASLLSGAAWGEEAMATADGGGEVEALMVVGIRGNIANSVARQRSADGVESVLTRDDVGQFPDQNVAEAVRRAPGVNVLNDQGEGASSPSAAWIRTSTPPRSTASASPRPRLTCVRSPSTSSRPSWSNPLRSRRP
jgi:outer membrane receptor for Fe3+-dicitrate